MASNLRQYSNVCPFLAIWFTPGETKLHVRVATVNNVNEGIGASAKALPLNAKTNVRVEAVGNEVRLFFNNTRDSVATVSGDRYSGAANVYVSDPWYAPASASVASISMTSISEFSSTSSMCKSSDM